MDWDGFWKLIDAAKADPGVLEQRLEELSEQDLVDFFWTYKGRAATLMEDEYVERLEEPYSEDEHEDIAEWVVRQGYKAYEAAAFDPAEFPSELPEDDDDVSYLSMAALAYERRFGQPIRHPDDPAP